MRKRLQQQVAVVPMTVGLQDLVDQRVLPVGGGLFEAINCRWDKDGALGKRNGFGAVTNTLADGSGNTIATEGNVRGLASTGTELVAFGARTLYAYDPKKDGWIGRGPLAPAVGKGVPILRARESFACADTARTGNYVVYVGHARSERNSTVANSIQFVGRTVTDEYTRGPEDLMTPVTVRGATTPHAPRVIPVSTGQARLFWLEGVATPINLLRAEWDITAAPQGAPGTPVTVASIVKYAGDNIRTYDVISLSTSLGYCVAYVTNTSAVTVETYDNNDVLVFSRTISVNNYNRVALAYDSVNDRIIVFLATSTAGVRAEAFALNRTTGLPTAWSATLDTADEPTELGVAVQDAAGNGVFFLWASQVVSAGDTFWRTRYESLTKGGAPLAAERVIFNWTPVSRPWWHGDQCYCAGAEFNRMGLSSYLAATSTVLNFRARENNTTLPPFLAGMYDVAVAPYDITDNALQHGSLNNVTAMPTSGVYRWASISTAIPSKDHDTRWAADEMEFDFGGKLTWARAYDGTLVVGGSLVNWYDGQGCFELGFAVPPLIAALSGAAGGTLPAGSTQSYNAIWEYYDARGLLHRSMPGPTKNFTLVGAEQSVNLTKTTSTPSTNRPGGKDGNLGVVYYRSVSGTLSRVSRPKEAVQNNKSSQFVNGWTDTGFKEGPILYTANGGELEAVAPDGAQSVAVLNDRLWLGGFWKRDRVQFSKRFSTAGVASEYALAPEFNEAFVRLMPSGSRITGLGSLHEKMVLFTEDEVYVVAGNGPDAAGRNDDLSPVTLVHSDAGCIEPRSVVEAPVGLLFQSKRGIYVLRPDLGLGFVGAPVKTRTETYSVVSSAVLVPKASEVRFTVQNTAGTAGKILVYNYRVDGWTEWDLESLGAGTNFVGAVLHQDVYYAVQANGNVWKEDSTRYRDAFTAGAGTGTWISMQIDSPWLQGAGPNGWQRVWEVTPLLERKAAAGMQVDVYVDYGASPDTTITITDAVASAWAVNTGPRLRVRRQKNQALRVRWRDSAETGSGRGFVVTGIRLDYGVQAGGSRLGHAQRY